MKRRGVGGFPSGATRKPPRCLGRWILRRSNGLDSTAEIGNDPAIALQHDGSSHPPAGFARGERAMSHPVRQTAFTAPVARLPDPEAGSSGRARRGFGATFGMIMGRSR